jgi:hypothetical protein
LCQQHSHVKQWFVLSRIPRLNILIEAYILINAEKFRYKLCFIVKKRFYGSRLHYIVKYSMNKLGNVQSVTSLAHLLSFSKKKNPKDLERKSMEHKTCFTFLYWPVWYFYSLTNTGSLFYLTTEIPFLYLVSYTQHAQRNECLYVTDCNQTWNDLKNFNKNSSTPNLIFFDSYSFVTCKKTDDKPNGAFSSLLVANTPNWE